MLRRNINSFLRKKRSRRDLLLYGGLSLLTLAGITGAVVYHSDLFEPEVAHGFGSGEFGRGRYGHNQIRRTTWQDYPPQVMTMVDGELS